MSTVELRNYAVATVLTACGFLFGGPITGCVFLFVGVVLFVLAEYKKNDVKDSLPLVPVLSPEKQQTPLEKAQLDELLFHQQIKAHAELILIWADNAKERLGQINMMFSDNDLRELLREDGDKLHIVMNYLASEGRAKRGSLPGYWYVN